MSRRAKRKVDHVRHALQTGQSNEQGLDEVRFVHNALSGIALHDVSLKTTIGDLELRSPIFINAMTGGAKKVTRINGALAEVAKATGLAMAVGSQMAAVKDPTLRHSYQIVREVNPHGVILANIGSEATVDEGQRAVNMIQADALQVHLNVVQELTMPEGDRDFTMSLRRIEALSKALHVPVWVKEVGFGISREIAKQLENAGVAAIDIGGRGGTNFARIENMRRDTPYSFFEDWGIRTTEALLEVSQECHLPLIATGGIKNALHVAKCLAMGASAVGMAGFMLRAVNEDGIEKAVEQVKEIHRELCVIMTALGCLTIAQLEQVPLVISGQTRDWLEARGYPVSLWACRESDKNNSFRSY